MPKAAPLPLLPPLPKAVQTDKFGIPRYSAGSPIPLPSRSYGVNDKGQPIHVETGKQVYKASKKTPGQNFGPDKLADAEQLPADPVPVYDPETPQEKKRRKSPSAGPASPQLPTPPGLPRVPPLPP